MKRCPEVAVVEDGNSLTLERGARINRRATIGARLVELHNRIHSLNGDDQFDRHARLVTLQEICQLETEYRASKAWAKMFDGTPVEGAQHTHGPAELTVKRTLKIIDEALDSRNQKRGAGSDETETEG